MSKQVAQSSKFAAKGPGFIYSQVYRNWKAAVLSGHTAQAAIYAAEHAARFAPRFLPKPKAPSFKHAGKHSRKYKGKRNG